MNESVPRTSSTEGELSPPAPQETILSALMRQAFWLSVLYLLLGLGLTIAGKLSASDGLTRWRLALDGVPHAVLDQVGLWTPLAEAVSKHTIPLWGARLVLAAVTVGVIHGQALALALLLMAMRAIWVRVVRL